MGIRKLERSAIRSQVYSKFGRTTNFKYYWEMYQEEKRKRNGSTEAK